ncbi:hypothetical protein [Synechococcus sp. BA-132 BA5]|uniref:hypothetical protein n=1 Tax=Synechococcus sp. BA-132 BA5 TaxID=3110252 RepID=UPI002B1F632E|nr:hypothetical protein [Synechococcus sp. BA-132 BA5]
MASLMPSSASAIQAVVGGKTYQVSTFSGSFNANRAKFTAADMPWFGSQGLARDFATTIGNQLGVGALGQGPLFAYSTFSLFGTVISSINAVNAFDITLSPVPIRAGTSRTYAVAQEIPVPVPAPLPLMGAGVAFGFSRRLRSRIQRSTTI